MKTKILFSTVVMFMTCLLFTSCEKEISPDSVVLNSELPMQKYETPDNAQGSTVLVRVRFTQNNFACKGMWKEVQLWEYDTPSMSTAWMIFHRSPSTPPYPLVHNFDTSFNVARGNHVLFKGQTNCPVWGGQLLIDTNGTNAVNYNGTMTLYLVKVPINP